MKSFLPLFLRLALVLSAVTLPAAEPSWKATVSIGGKVTLFLGGKEVGTVVPGLFEKGWQGREMTESYEAPAPGAPRSGLITAGGGVVNCAIRETALTNGVRLQYVLTPAKALELNTLHVALTLPMSLTAGQRFRLDGVESLVPPALASNIILGARQAGALELDVKGGPALVLSLARPESVLVQDNRRWTDSLGVRLGPQDLQGRSWPAGKQLTLEFSLTSSNGIPLERVEPVTIRAGADWVPLAVDLDIEPESALDFSGFGQRDAPAGKHGWLTARADGHLAFERSPGVARRFYGVNLCFSAQYLDHGQADRLADRLMRLGYNTVRLHHYEGELVTVTNDTSTRLNPVALDQLDYLFAACKQRGLYLTTDLFVSRPVQAREVWPDAGPGALGADDFKMLVPVNDRAFANWALFARNLLTHVNPHTGLSYASDPALAWLSMINEGNAENYLGRIKGRTADAWKGRWNAWLVSRHGDAAGVRKAWGREPGGDPGAGTVPLPTNVNEDTPAMRDCLAFCADLETAMMGRMRALLKDELKCRALLTNRNGWGNRLITHAARAGYDYVDDHFYVDHPHFLQKPWSLPSHCPNVSPIAGGAPGGRGNAFVRVYGKPFTISEYNYSAPGQFRGVGGILTGALGALQDWDVLWRFAYSHNRQAVTDVTRLDYFNTAGDPLNQAAERASLCLYLRGDLSPAPHGVAVAMTPGELTGERRRNLGQAPGWNELAWVARMGTLLTGGPAPAGVGVVLPLGWQAADGGAFGPAVFPIDPYRDGVRPQVLDALKAGGGFEGNRTDHKARRYESETRQILIDAAADKLVLDTERTAGGYAPRGATITTRAVTVRDLDTAATVWVSSVDGRPIAESRRLIITHLTDLQNSETVFADPSRQTLLAWGRLPHLVLNGSATVEIRMAQAARARVHALATGGKRLGEVKGFVREGALVVPVAVRGPEGARLVYEVSIE